MGLYEAMGYDLKRWVGSRESYVYMINFPQNQKTVGKVMSVITEHSWHSMERLQSTLTGSYFCSQ